MKNDFNRYITYLQWTMKDGKQFIPKIFLIICVGSLSALTGVGIAVESKHMIDYAIAKDLQSAIFAAIVFAGLILSTLLLNAVGAITSVHTLEAYSNSIRQRIFARISSTEWSQISKYHSGDILTRLTSDVNAIANLVINVFPSVVTLAVQLTAAFVILFNYQPYLALSVLLLAPFTIVFSRIWGKKLKLIQIKVQESESKYRSFIQERIEHLMIIKAFRLEKMCIENIGLLHKDRMVWISRKNRTSVTASTIMAIGYWSGYFLAFVWGAFSLAQRAITFGTLTAFIQLVGQIQGPFIGLVRSLPQAITAIASIGRLMELEEIQLEKSHELLPASDGVKIQFKEVDFEYLRGQPILGNINISIQQGELVAFTGHSGEGKTTIIRLLLALLRPTAGKVTFINKQIEYEACADTRDWISYIPQGNTLFSGTILENIRVGKIDATINEIKDAAQAACAWEFIEKLPEGMNTLIGEKGYGLSEGQAQRIAIARALIKSAPVLILDEATSALDLDTEMCVLREIKNINPPRTCLIVTHRKSALSICSRVLKLQNGRLYEEPLKSMKIG